MKTALFLLLACLAHGQTFTGPTLAAICPGTTTWDSTNDPAMAAAPYPSLLYVTGKPFTCTVPVKTAGMTAVSVAMEEPNKSGAGQRVFSITVNGQQSASLDLFSLTGGKLRTYEYDPSFFYATSKVSITFSPTVGNAVVSSITVLPSTSTGAALDPLDPRLMPAIDTDPAHYPANVWTTGALAKVQQNTGAPGPAKWAVVHAARNEIASFQAHVQAPAAGISALTAAMSDLTNMQTGARILAASTDVIVYREVCEHLQGFPTATGPTFLWSAWSAPFSAFVPDALIPDVEPYYHQKTSAFPVAVAAGMNQSVWVDVHVPQNAPSGYYSGVLTLRDGQVVLATLPVVYAVWDWAMPSTSSLPSIFPTSYASLFTQTGGGAAYPNALGSEDFGVTLTDTDLSAQMLDNRISSSYGTNVYNGSGDFGPDNDVHTAAGGPSFDYVYAPLLDGKPGRVATILPGAKWTTFEIKPLEPAQFDGPTFQNYADHFAARGWPRPTYGLWDEPANDAPTWAALVAKGTQTRPFSAPRTPNYVTTDIDTATARAGLGVIDHMIVNVPVLMSYGAGPPQDVARYTAWVAGDKGNRVFGSYSSCSNAGTCGNGTPGPQAGFPNSYPNYDIDGTPVANRIMEWATWRNGQTVELYFSLDHMFGPGGDVPAGSNPWASNYYSGGWGDGTLVYPGGNAASPCAPLCDVGVATPIWIPSIRVKMIRDGMQDYEYMAALAAAGQKALADAQVASVLTDALHFTTDPAVLQAARDAMGAALHKLAGH